MDGRGIRRGINVCGAATVDPAMGVPIDITFKHSDETLELIYGSSLDSDPCSGSFAVSDIEILVL